MADDDRLKKHLKELSKAIREALGASDDLAQILERIRATGHDAYLILEATVAVRKRDEKGEGEVAAASTGEITEGPPSWSGSDMELLKELRLRVETEPQDRA